MSRWVRFVLACVLLLGCSAPERRDGDDSDDSTDAGPSADAGATSCRLDGECGSGHCDRSRGTCVRCLAAAHCAGNEACSLGRCVPRVACTSSRTCPGQVCDPSAGYCVDCAGDNDCATGEHCSGNLCLAAPPSCQSSRECSVLGRVCDPASHVCVDCAADTDCDAGQFCANTTCHPRVCVPDEVVCDGLTGRKHCDLRGTGFIAEACGPDESCADGACRQRLCTPGSARCVSTTARAACDATGLAENVQPCGAGESCAAGSCRPRVCVPGAVDCASSSQSRTCDSDGLGYTTAACPGAPHATGVCGSAGCTTACQPGYADCNGVASDGCEASLGSPDTCGSCANRCPSAPSAVATCTSGGQCGLACVAGTVSCGGACVPDLATEACDGVDNDCDGQIDEGCGNGTCASPYVVAPQGGVLSGVMSGYSTVIGGCGYSAGVDRVFRWIPARSGTATINLSGDYYPVSLYVKAGSCTGTEIACRSSQSWTSPTVNPSVTAGSAYDIVVDAAWSGTTVPAGYTLPHWTLTVTPPP